MYGQTYLWELKLFHSRGALKYFQVLGWTPLAIYVGVAIRGLTCYYQKLDAVSGKFHSRKHI